MVLSQRSYAYCLLFCFHLPTGFEKKFNFKTLNIHSTRLWSLSLPRLDWKLWPYATLKIVLALFFSFSASQRVEIKVVAEGLDLEASGLLELSGREELLVVSDQDGPRRSPLDCRSQHPERPKICAWWVCPKYWMLSRLGKVTDGITRCPRSLPTKRAKSKRARKFVDSL